MRIPLKLVSFLTKGRRVPRVGAVLHNGSLLDVGAEMQRPVNSHTMLAMIRSRDADSLFLKLRDKVNNGNYKPENAIDAFRVTAPLIPDRNVFCVGKNYSDHIAEVNKAHDNQLQSKKGGMTIVPAKVAETGPAFPVWFTKAPETIVGPGEGIKAHKKLTKWLDYEVELAVIIGKGGVNIMEENAMNHIFGYTVANDVTAREVQKRHLQWFKGKNLDTFCPMGPCIVPKFEMEDASDLRLQCSVNGELRQDSTTASMIFSIPQLIASLSKGFTLKPGDIILTGTPDGVGFAMNPPKMLKRGDEVLCEIQNIGRLQNKVVL